MQKTLYIPIDTTIDNLVECEKLIKRGDILTLTIKIFVNGVLADLTGQSIDLILKKADNTLIESTITTVTNGVITATLKQQATLVQGLVSGEVQIYTSTTLTSTNTFTFKVDASLADDVLEVSKDDIQVLADLRNLIASGQVVITQYENSILAIGNTVEAVEALANIKAYIDTNLPALENANAQAVVNIANETTQNTKADNNISDLSLLNNTASTLKTGLEADIASGTTLKNTLEADIASGTTLKNGLESDISTGNTLKTNLEADIASGTTLKNDIDAENVRAEANIVAMEGFGDVTALSQNVTNLKNEVETARNGEVSLDARLDKNDTAVANLVTQSSERVKKTTADITYYVNASTGSDTNDGLTSGTAFKTIQHVIDILPQAINHIVTIQLSLGTYNEDVSIKGFVGSGEIKISGGTDLASASNYIIKSVTGHQTTCSIKLYSCTFNSTATHSIFFWACLKATVYYCRLANSVSLNGLYCGFSIVYVVGCDFSARSKAINADFGSTIISSGNTGTSNEIGLYAQYASTIGKVGTQPSGTTAESTSGGGVIR